ncbi:MAG: hypothetical protein JXA96_17030 [Sedimentisphaerales bacterium]|nr:hypothetical protein [Sedimentisphaerales bacterium]
MEKAKGDLKMDLIPLNFVRKLKRNIIIVILIVCIIFDLSFCIDFAQGSIPVSVEVSSPQKTIRIGEPLFVLLTCRFKEQQKDPDEESVYPSFGHRCDILIEFKDEDKKWIDTLLAEHPDADFSLIPGNEESIKWYPLHLKGHIPESLYVQDKDGLEYGAYFLALYNPYKKGVIFDKPGKYKISGFSYEYTNKVVLSNTIEINVASKSLPNDCILPDPNYCDFLMGNRELLKNKPEYSSKVFSFLENIIKKCPDTLFAKIAAARLGIENTKSFEYKYSETRTFIEQYRKGKIKDPLIESAKKYLSIAYGLPDEIPIRETAIYNLATFELFDGNATKAFSIYDELAAKYPQGNYGKKALRDKKDSQEFIDNHPDLFIAEATQPQEQKPLGVALPIAGAAVAVIAIAGLILFSRKKKQKKGNNK